MDNRGALRTGVITIAFLLIATAARAQTLEDRIRALEKGLDPAPAAARAGGIDAWFDGHLRFGTRDGSFTGRLGGYLVQHTVLFDRLNERDQRDTFAIEEAAIEVSARLDRSWEVFVSMGHQSGASRLLYGWAEFNRWPELRIRAGLFKEPISMETLEDTRWWDFIENSVVYMHDPVPDLGVMAHGTLGAGLVSYAAGVFNGNRGFNGTDENSDKDAAARVLFAPTDLIGWEALKHLHVAVSATHGRWRRRAPVTPFPMFDPATGTVFHVAPPGAVFETEDLTRLSAEFAALIGPLEIKAQGSRLAADMDFAGDHRRFRSPGWYVQAGFWIGGSRLPFGVPVVEEPLFAGGWGALQVAGRYARLRMNDAFEKGAGFAGARSIETIAVVVNWFPNEHVRVSAEYLFASYEARRVPLPSGREITDESVFLFRVQLSF